MIKTRMATARREAAAGLTIVALLLAAAALPAGASPATTTTSGAGASRKDLWKGFPANPFCPWDAVKLGACAGVLGAVSVQAGAQLGSKCCQLAGGLAAGEAAACFCTTIKESVLGIPTEWTVGVGLLASACKTDLPDGFKCV